MGKREVLLATLALMLLGLTAQAAGPAFSPAEQAIIARNASLREGVRKDPGAVRRALDTLAADRPAGTRSREGSVEGLFDEKTDPDLGKLQRASPEAAYDLFQLLKKASDAGTPAPPPKQSR